MKVLLVDDNQQVMATMADYLDVAGVQVECAYHGEAALRLLSEHTFDVIVMDIMMPRLDGVATVQKIRNELYIATPILFLTARDTLDDKTSAFAAGGDDYLVKPFALPELLLRLKALSRRGSPTSMSCIDVGELRFDTRSNELSRAGKIISLGRIQTQIIRLLMQKHPAVISRQDIIDTVWKDDEPSSDALRSHIYALRQALDDGFSYSVLITVHGQGYRLAERP